MTRDEAMLAVSTGDFKAIDAIYTRLAAAEACIEAADAALSVSRESCEVGCCIGVVGHNYDAARAAWEITK